MDEKTNWNEGYPTEVEYTNGYYRELSPNLLRLVCLVAGVAPPATDPLRYLELGYGQGLSVNIHAAAVPGEFWGTDFNPVQVGQARSLAAVSRSGVKLLDDSFVELAGRPDLPDFDLIVLHGIWTWVTDENRRVIVDIIRRKLRVGGILYLSYNCLPGWAAAMPMRHLIKLHADLAGSPSANPIGKLEGALDFALRVVDAGALYFREYPSVTARLKKIAEQDRNYLVHEYLPRHWRPMAFSEVIEWLAPARLDFIGSSHPLDYVDGLNLSAAARELLAQVQHPILKQSVRDYLVNQQFRRDLFVKGPRRLASRERQQLLQSQSFVLTSYAQAIPLKIMAALGEATLQEHIYRPLIEVMAEKGYAPKTLGQIAAHTKLRSLEFGQVLEAMLVLIGAGHAFPAQSSASQSSRTYCRTLNRHLCEGARNGGENGFLASPVTGAGVPVTRFHRTLAFGDAGRQENRSRASRVRLRRIVGTRAACRPTWQAN